MPGTVVSIDTIEDLYPIAASFNELLSMPENHDISDEFPATINNLIGGITIQSTLNRLIKLQELHQPGIREQFIVYSDITAAGMFAILPDDGPSDSDHKILGPNVSGFICEPYRGKKLSHLVMERIVETLDSNFDSKAWTLVDPNNTPSQRMVRRAGFIAVGQTKHLGSVKDLLIYV